MKILKHIIISQAIILLVGYICTNLSLFSNQIHSLNLSEAQTADNQIQSIQSYIQQYQNNQRIKQVKQMSKLSRFLLSHTQFDGIHFFTNQYKYQPNFAFIRGYTMMIDFIKFATKNLYEYTKLSEIQYLGKQIRQNQLLAQILLLVLINKVFFALSAYKMYQISYLLNQNKQKSRTITLLFIYNPSCIFFNSVYTQSIYSFLTFSSFLILLKLYKNESYNIQSLSSNQKILQFKSDRLRYAQSVLLLSISILFRTNGIFLCLIFGLPIIFQLWLNLKKYRIKKSAKILLEGIIILISLLAPLAYYLVFTFKALCVSDNNGLIHDQSLREQCQNYTFFPNLYNFIQQKFWSVGFLKYFKPSNFIFIMFGMPAIFVGSGVFYIVKRQGMKFIDQFRNVKESQQLLSRSMLGLKLVKIGLYTSFCILYLVTLFLTNIQSSTRFFCSHPVFYVIIEQKIGQKWIKLWMLYYFIFGTVLYYVGFPWT